MSQKRDRRGLSKLTKNRKEIQRLLKIQGFWLNDADIMKIKRQNMMSLLDTLQAGRKVKLELETWANIKDGQVVIKFYSAFNEYTIVPIIISNKQWISS